MAQTSEAENTSSTMKSIESSVNMSSRGSKRSVPEGMCLADVIKVGAVLRKSDGVGEVRSEMSTRASMTLKEAGIGPYKKLSISQSHSAEYDMYRRRVSFSDTDSENNFMLRRSINAVKSKTAGASLADHIKEKRHRLSNSTNNVGDQQHSTEQHDTSSHGNETRSENITFKDRKMLDTVSNNNDEMEVASNMDISHKKSDGNGSSIEDQRTDQTCSNNHDISSGEGENYASTGTDLKKISKDDHIIITGYRNQRKREGNEDDSNGTEVETNEIKGSENSIFTSKVSDVDNEMLGENNDTQQKNSGVIGDNNDAQRINRDVIDENNDAKRIDRDVIGDNMDTWRVNRDVILDNNAERQTRRDFIGDNDTLRVNPGVIVDNNDERETSRGVIGVVNHGVIVDNKDAQQNHDDDNNTKSSLNRNAIGDIDDINRINRDIIQANDESKLQEKVNDQEISDNNNKNTATENTGEEDNTNVIGTDGRSAKNKDKVGNAATQPNYNLYTTNDSTHIPMVLNSEANKQSHILQMDTETGKSNKSIDGQTNENRMAVETKTQDTQVDVNPNNSMNSLIVTLKASIEEENEIRKGFFSEMEDFHNYSSLAQTVGITAAAKKLKQKQKEEDNVINSKPIPRKGNSRSSSCSLSTLKLANSHSDINESQSPKRDKNRQNVVEENSKSELEETESFGTLQKHVQGGESNSEDTSTNERQGEVDNSPNIRQDYENKTNDENEKQNSESLQTDRILSNETVLGSNKSVGMIGLNKEKENTDTNISNEEENIHNVQKEGRRNIKEQKTYANSDPEITEDSEDKEDNQYHTGVTIKEHCEDVCQNSLDKNHDDSEYDDELYTEANLQEYDGNNISDSERECEMKQNTYNDAEQKLDASDINADYSSSTELDHKLLDSKPSNKNPFSFIYPEDLPKTPVLYNLRDARRSYLNERRSQNVGFQISALKSSNTTSKVGPDSNISEQYKMIQFERKVNDNINIIQNNSNKSLMYFSKTSLDKQIIDSQITDSPVSKKKKSRNKNGRKPAVDNQENTSTVPYSLSFSKGNLGENNKRDLTKELQMGRSKKDKSREPCSLEKDSPQITLPPLSVNCRTQTTMNWENIKSKEDTEKENTMLNLKSSSQRERSFIYITPKQKVNYIEVKHCVSRVDEILKEISIIQRNYQLSQRQRKVQHRIIDCRSTIELTANEENHVVLSIDRPRLILDTSKDVFRISKNIHAYPSVTMKETTVDFDAVCCRKTRKGKALAALKKKLKCKDTLPTS